VRSARSVQQFERNLREEQDSAYERSLTQDRERARQRREAEAAAAEKEREEREKAETVAAQAEKRSQWKQWRAKSIAPEPSLESKDIVRIALKMPEAARITRRFASDASIEELYAFVECYDVLQEGAAGDVTRPEKYDHKYDFRLVSVMPRAVYAAEGGTIGEKVGKSGNLIVERTKDDEDEE
jgi:FAS-associated factor 2